MHIEWDAKKLRARVEYNVKDMLMFIKDKSFLIMSASIVNEDIVWVKGDLIVELKKRQWRPIVDVNLVKYPVLDNSPLGRPRVVATLAQIHFRSSAEAKVFLSWYANNKEEFWRQFLMGFAKELEGVCEALSQLKYFELKTTLP